MMKNLKEIICVRVKSPSSSHVCNTDPIGYYFDPFRPFIKTDFSSFNFLIAYNGGVGRKQPSFGEYMRAINWYKKMSYYDIMTSGDVNMIQQFQINFPNIANSHFPIIHVFQLGSKYSIPINKQDIFRGYRSYQEINNIFIGNMGNPARQKGRITFTGSYSGINGTYDPFNSATNSGAGLIYYQKDGCSVRTTRFFAYSEVNSDSLFSTPPSLTIIQPCRAGIHSYRAKGLVDFKKNTPYAIPLVDPNSKITKIISSHNSKPTLFSDNSNNLFIQFDSACNGQLEYEATTAKPIWELAFIDPSKLQSRLPIQPSSFGINKLEKTHTTYASLIKSLQDYFSEYDKTCHLGHSQLESQPNRQSKIDYMNTHKTGSCRHRAFLAYLILKSTGTLTHYVVSRTHAWIECYIQDAWRYIDLGGCHVDTDIIPEDAGIEEMKGMPSYNGEPIEKYGFQCGIYDDCINCHDRSPSRIIHCGYYQRTNKEYKTKTSSEKQI